MVTCSYRIRVLYIVGFIVVIVVVVIHTKIARSQYLDILLSGQSCQDVENGEK